MLSAVDKRRDESRRGEHECSRHQGSAHAAAAEPAGCCIDTEGQRAAGA